MTTPEKTINVTHPNSSSLSSTALFASHPFITRWALSAVSSVFAECITYPIDTIRIHRIQARSHDHHPKIKWNFENFRHLYSGLSPALQRALVQGGISMSLYTPLRSHFGGTTSDPDGRRSSIFVKAACSSVSGALGQFVSNPLDIAKTIIQADSRSRMSSTSSSTAASSTSSSSSSSTLSVLRLIHKYEGIKGLYTGALPSLIRSGIINASWVVSYDISKLMISDYITSKTSLSYIEQEKIYKYKIINYMISSQICSLFCCITSGPLDVVKTRLFTQTLLTHYQNDLMRENKSMIVNVRQYEPYTSTFNCISRVVAEEGFFALWRGFVPSLIRTTPWSLSFFVIYESLSLHLIGHAPI